MAHQQQRRKAQPHRVVNGVADIVAASAPILQLQPQRLLGKGVPIVAGGHQQVFHPGGFGHILLQIEGVDEGGLAHRPDDAAGTQDGDTSLNAQPGIEGAFRQSRPLRYRDGDGQPAGIARLSRLPLRLLQNHPPGGGIDGGRPHRLVQAGPGHPAHTGAAVDGNAGAIGPFRLGTDQRTVGHIRVVSAVLSHPAAGPARASSVVQQLGLHLDPRRGTHPDGGEPLPRQQQPDRPGCGGGSAGTGGVAAAQLPVPHRDIHFQHRTAPLSVKKGPPQMGRAFFRRKNAAPLHLRVTQNCIPAAGFLARASSAGAPSQPTGQWFFAPLSALTVEVRLRRISTGFP